MNRFTVEAYEDGKLIERADPVYSIDGACNTAAGFRQRSEVTRVRILDVDTAPMFDWTRQPDHSWRTT